MRLFLCEAKLAEEPFRPKHSQDVGMILSPSSLAAKGSPLSAGFAAAGGGESEFLWIPTFNLNRNYAYHGK